MNLKEIFAKNLQYYLDRNGITQTELAHKLNYPEMTVSNWIKAKTYPRIDKVQQMADFFNISRSDLTEEKTNNVYLAMSAYPYFPANVAAGLPENISGITKSDMEQINIPDSIMGKWAGNKDIFLTRINGDSMDKVMPSHSLIAVKTINLSELNNGDMVVFSDNYEYSVKYYYKQNDTLIFKPHSTNESHHDQIYSVDDNITIHGKVVIYIVERD